MEDFKRCFIVRDKKTIYGVFLEESLAKGAIDICKETFNEPDDFYIDEECQEICLSLKRFSSIL